jgi:hypothetical protein
MDVDLQSLFGLHGRCFPWLRPRNSLRPSTRIWTRITRALLVSKDRRHLFVTPCSKKDFLLKKINYERQPRLL